MCHQSWVRWYNQAFMPRQTVVAKVSHGSCVGLARSWDIFFCRATIFVQLWPGKAWPSFVDDVKRCFRSPAEAIEPAAVTTSGMRVSPAWRLKHCDICCAVVRLMALFVDLKARFVAQMLPRGLLCAAARVSFLQCRCTSEVFREDWPSQESSSSGSRPMMCPSS